MSLEAWGDENPLDADYDSWADRAMDAGWIDPADYSPGALAILRERERQETVEGWTPEHDDIHGSGEIAGAAACYTMQGLDIGANHLGEQVRVLIHDLWPWDRAWWKPSDDPIRNLEKAGALIAAEIDRLKRAQRQST